MSISIADTLPSGMGERTFALVHSETDDVLMFGRGTDYPCSEYVFPAVEALGSRFSIHGNHASAFGQMDISSNYFEASFGATEPHAADKISRIMSAWAMANFQRPHSGLHHLYYVLGGRARVMYGVPDRIAPKHNGFKASFHEGILRFATSSPFFYDSARSTATPDGSPIALPVSNSEVSSTFSVQSKTEVPTPISFFIETSSGTGKADVDIDIRNGGTWRRAVALRAFGGQMLIENQPGRAVTRHEPKNVSPENPRSSGADFIGPSTPPFRLVTLRPGDSEMRVTANGINSTGNLLTVQASWRDCYAGA